MSNETFGKNLKPRKSSKITLKKSIEIHAIFGFIAIPWEYRVVEYFPLRYVSFSH
jgi:hypothetical protein